MTAQPAGELPSFADQVLAVDVPALAKRIQEQGSRAAIQASTVEIVAMAVQLCDLAPVVNNTFDLLVTADDLHDEVDPVKRAPLRSKVKRLINEIAEALQALGYGQSKTAAKEESHV